MHGGLKVWARMSMSKAPGLLLLSGIFGVVGISFHLKLRIVPHVFVACTFRSFPEGRGE